MSHTNNKSMKNEEVQTVVIVARSIIYHEVVLQELLQQL